MKTKSFAIVTMALAVALGMAMCAPLAGCSGCSASRESDFIEKSADGKPTKKTEADQTKAQKTKDSAVGTDTKTGQEAASATTNTKADSSESKSSTPMQTTPSKASTSKSTESNGNGPKPAGSQKKWVPEQGHWKTDYGQVWIPNIVYTRHERYWIVTHNGNVGPFDSKSAADAWVYNDTINGGSGGSLLNDSYTITEDQGYYEQQATGQHWVVDVAGHWE